MMKRPFRSSESVRTRPISAPGDLQLPDRDARPTGTVETADRPWVLSSVLRAWAREGLDLLGRTATLLVDVGRF